VAKRARVLSTKVQRSGQQKRPTPPVWWIERQRLSIADEVEEQPDDKPDQGHVVASAFASIRVGSMIAGPDRGAIGGWPARVP
jgi:hypothetical protein